MPFVQEAVRIDPRIQVSEIPSQDVISRDNVSMKVDAVLYFNIVDPERAIIRVRSLPSSHGHAGANHTCARCSASIHSTKCCRSARSSAPTFRVSSTSRSKPGVLRSATSK